MKNQNLLSITFMFILFFVTRSSLTKAQNVREDSTFNFTGLAGIDIDSTNDDNYSSALQSDGKIVMGGATYISNNWNYTLSRLNSDGSVDTSFGDAGRVYSSNGMGNIAGVEIQPDGKIVAGGITGSINFGIVRYLSDGTIDSTFDGDGYAFHSPTGIYVADLADISIQSDGKIIAVGTSSNGTVDDMVVMRLNNDGTLDTTFNGTGIVTYVFFGFGTNANAVTLQPDGKILAGGKRFVNGTNNDFVIIRLNTNGSFDSTFNSAGVQAANLIDDDAITHIAVQADGKIIATGASTDNALGKYASIVRFNPNGLRDSTFSGDGKLLIGGSWACASFPLPNGDLIVGSASSFMLRKVNSNGDIDSLFGTNGYYITNLIGGPTNGYVTDGFIQPDGRIVLTGKATIDPALSYDMSAVRYIINPNYFCSANFTLYADTIPQNWIAVNQATGTPPLTYSWKWGDGSALSSGATPSHTYSSPGYYNICLTVTDANGCTNTYCDSSTYLNRLSSNSLIITVNVVLPTGIHEQIVGNNSFTIYPNPSSGHFTISFSDIVSNGAIEIYSVLGEKVFSQKIDNDTKKEIKINNSLHGIYFVKVFDGENYYSKKIILE